MYSCSIFDLNVLYNLDFYNGRVITKQFFKWLAMVLITSKMIIDYSVQLFEVQWKLPWMQIFNIQKSEKLHAVKLEKRNKCVLCSCIRDEKTYYCIECGKSICENLRSYIIKDCRHI